METCQDTMWPVDVPPGHLIAWSTMCAILTPVIVILNVILIIAMVKSGETKSFTPKFVICMSISDIGMGAIALPFLFTMLTFRNLRENCIFQNVVQCLAYTFGYTTFFLLIAIGLDRYLLITRLTKYKLMMNDSRFRVCVITIALTSFACSVVTITVYGFYLHMSFIIVNVLLIGGVYILYAKLLRRINRQAATITKTEEDSTEKKLMRRKTKRRKRDISVLRTIKILLGTIFALYMPYNTVSIVWTYYRFQLKRDPGLVLNVTVFWTYVLMFFNCTANALIYGHGNGKLRRYVKHMLFKGFTDKNTSPSKYTESENTRFPDAQISQCAGTSQ